VIEAIRGYIVGMGGRPMELFDVGILLGAFIGSLYLLEGIYLTIERIRK